MKERKPTSGERNLCGDLDARRAIAHRSCCKRSGLKSAKSRSLGLSLSRKPPTRYSGQHREMINGRINGRFITVDNLSMRPTWAGIRAVQSEIYVMFALTRQARGSLFLSQLFPEHSNYPPLKLQRWIKADYARDSRSLLLLKGNSLKKRSEGAAFRVKNERRKLSGGDRKKFN